MYEGVIKQDHRQKKNNNKFYDQTQTETQTTHVLKG